MASEAIATVARKASGHVPQLLNPIEPDELDVLLDHDDYVAQPKIDGERRGGRLANNFGWSVSSGRPMLVAAAT